MDKFQWWTELTHGGIFISNPVLNESFEERQVETWHWKYKRLRDNYNSFLSKESIYRRGSHPVHAWITHLFEDFLGHDSNHWLKGQNIPQRFSILSKTGMPIKPRRVLTDENGETILLLQRDESQRLGIHKGRRSYAQFVELLRKTNVPLGVLINGHQIRLVYAGMDHDAWVQFQVDAWFDEGETRHQLDGFLTLLHPDNLKVEDGSFPLLDAVNTSRTRQADLADVLGDQIRQAVELLTSAIGRIQQTDQTFLDTVQISTGTKTILSEVDTLNAIYQAATRLVMRKVILFYAEAKELLPKDNPFYFDNYSIEGLYSQLLNAVQHAGEEELKTKYSAWQRFLALSNMVHEGSEHEALPLKAYGGTLFRRGNKQNPEIVLRALSLFEQPNIGITDYEVYQILRLIKIGKTKVRQGRSSTYVSGPVDFGDMRTEYIGMMYEGLLDYELKKVEHNDPKVIMSIGDQPILPLKLLEPMDDTAIKNLFKTMKVETDATTSVEDSPLFNQGEEETSGEHLDDSTAYGRSLRWAVKAVEVARLVARPRGAAAMQFYEEKKLEKARSLVVSVLEPGEMYLSRWGGTRKGSGTFYTKPSLAVPTTWRTLEPLVYDIEGEEKKVKTPKDILNLNVCDPAVGSGTFLVASARYLTEVLYESVLTHILVHRDDEGNVVIAPSEQVSLTLDVQFEAPPIKPTDDGWEEQMKARLKRLIVERCLFGVDYNGMAVELARLALWLETMDKDLPFELLDHRIKQGNSLVGTWFSQYRNYPAKAWERQDGTGKDRNNKKILRDIIKPELVTVITGAVQYSILEEAEPPEVTLNRQMQYWTELEETQLFDTEKREEIYRKKIEDDEDYKKLKHQFDRWCAVWFWPSENENNPTLSPKTLFSNDERIRDIVLDLSSRHHFFHWELEFPEVFTKTENHETTGFDAIVGNPPWDIQKPNSQEFFSNFDPIYRTYGKQEALLKRQNMFEESPEIKHFWLEYNRDYYSFINFTINAKNPYDISFGKSTGSSELKQLWENKRKKQPKIYCGNIPYMLQGEGFVNYYKLFLEVSFHLMGGRGRLGMIIPSAFYSDKGSAELRNNFINKSNWDWLFIFENKEKIFDIHRSSKFGPIILTKDGHTESIKCAFMQKSLKSWESIKPPYMDIPVDIINRFSPISKSIIEFKSKIDLQIFEKLYQATNNWGITYGIEYTMTTDSHLFPPITNWVENGYKPNILGQWINNQGQIAIPLYEGRMLGQYDYSDCGWVSGRGRSAIWRKIPIHQKTIEPQFLMSQEKYMSSNYVHSFKIGIMRISSATNSRTIIAGPIFNYPVGNSINVVKMGNCSDIEKIFMLAYYNSFAMDFAIRLRMAGTNITHSILNELPYPPKSSELIKHVAKLCAELIFIFPASIGHIKKLKKELNKNINPRINIYQRLQAKIIIDVLVFEIMGLNIIEVQNILSSDVNNSIGFWRIDKTLPIEQRQTTLTLEAFKHLKQVGLEQFLEEGWELPDYVTEFDRPGIKIWEPDGGWEKAWAEAKAMLTEEEWKEFTGESVVESDGSSSEQEEELAQQGLF